MGSSYRDWSHREWCDGCFCWFLGSCGWVCQGAYEIVCTPVFEDSQAHCACTSPSPRVVSTSTDFFFLAQVHDKLDRVPTSPERMAGGTPRSSSSFDLPSGVKSSPPPKTEDSFEILCGEVVLPLDITLAAVKQFVWRQSTDLVMYYRRKS
jgi:hypothetical protein